MGHDMLSIHPDVMACDLDDSVAILNPSTGTYYSLDEVGRFVWLQLGECATFAALNEAVVDRYDCDPETAATDLRNLLNDLHHAKLITIDATRHA